MVGFILRIVIVTAVFLAGVMVGNIYMPQKRLEHGAVTSIGEPNTSDDFNRDINLEEALKSLAQAEAALTAAGTNPETVFIWKDTIQRALFAQAYQNARNKYTLELLRTESNPTDRAPFLKAQADYLKIKELIEATFPAQKDEVVEILTTPATAAADNNTAEEKSSGSKAKAVK